MQSHFRAVYKVLAIAILATIFLVPAPSAKAQAGTNTLVVCTQQLPNPNMIRTKTFRWWSGLGGYFDQVVDATGNSTCTVVSTTLGTGSWNFSQTIYSGWSVFGNLVQCVGDAQGSYTWTQATRNLNVTITSNNSGTIYCYAYVDDLLN